MTKDEAITAVKEVTEMSLPWDDRHYEALQMAIKALEEHKRKKGKWIDKSGGIEGAWNYCSVCGEQAIDLYDFCPNCGADMRGEQDE